MSVAWNLQPWMEDATVAGSAGCVKGGGELELKLCSGWNWIQQGTRSRTVFFFKKSRNRTGWLPRTGFAASWAGPNAGRNKMAFHYVFY